MTIFSESYVADQLQFYLTESVRFKFFRSLRDHPRRQFVFHLDIEGSTQYPDLIRKSVCRLICLLAVTEVLGRGGTVVHDGGDGLTAFFQEPSAALRTALSMYHRQEEIGEKFISGIRGISNISPPRFGYRLLLSTLSSSSTDPLGDWLTAESRYGNKDRFLITHGMYEELHGDPRLHGLRDLFDPPKRDGSGPVDVIWAKGGKKEGIPLNQFGRGLHRYQDNCLVPASGEAPTVDLRTPLSAAELEKVLQGHVQDFRRWVETTRVPSFLRFSLLPLDAMHPNPVNRAAAIFGDVNLDFSIKISQEDFRASVDSHRQDRQQLNLGIGGKSINIAEALRERGIMETIIIVAKLGIDREGFFILEELNKHNAYRKIAFLTDSAHRCYD